MVQLGARELTSAESGMTLRLAAADTDSHLAALDAALANISRIADSIAVMCAQMCNAMAANDARQATSDRCAMQLTSAVQQLTQTVDAINDPEVPIQVNVAPAASAPVQVMPAQPTKKVMHSIKRDEHGMLISAVIEETP